jgi:hypothetical protein
MSAVEDAKKQQALAEEARRKGIPEWQLEAARAVPDDVVRSLVSDFRRGPSPPSSIAAKPATPDEKRPSFTEPAPLDVPGIRYVDQLCDHFAKLDQAERIKQALEIAAMAKRSEKMK